MGHERAGGGAQPSAFPHDLRPKLSPGPFVFATFPGPLPPECIASVVEDEGTSAVLPKDVAESLGLPYEFTCAMITLQAQSRLDSVGLTARVASVLAEAGISCNVVAGHFHDHLFVPAARGEEAVRLLQGPAVTA